MPIKIVFFKLCIFQMKRTLKALIEKKFSRIYFVHVTYLTKLAISTAITMCSSAL